MATTIYLKKDLNSGAGLGAYYYASGFPALGNQHSADTNTTIGGTLIQCTYSAGDPEILAWVSPPIASPVTISGSIAIQIGGSESSGAHAQLRFQLYKFSGGAEGAQFSGASMGAELTTTPTRYSWSDGAPTSTSFAVGDRIAIKMFIANFGTMAAGTAGIVYGDNSSVQLGFSFMQFAEAISFTQEPEYVQGGNTLTNPFTFGGASLAHDSILALIGVTHGAVINTVGDGTNTYTQVEMTVAASNDFDIYTFLAKDIAAGGPYSISVAMTSGTWGNTGAAEYYGLTTNPLDQHCGAGGNSNTFNSGSRTTTQAQEIIAGLAAEHNGLNFTAGPGFVVRFPLHLINDQNYWEDKFVTSIGSYNATGTLVSPDLWAATMVTLNAISAAPPPTVSTPTISPNGGNFQNSTSVTLSDVDSGLSGFVMYYTTDGSTPTPISNLYAGPFTIIFNCTVQAVAIATGYSNSAIASAVFTLTDSSGGQPLGSLDVIPSTVTQENILRHVVYRGTMQANASNAIYPAGGIPLKAIFNAAFNPNGQLDYIKAWSKSGSGYIYSYVLSADKLMVLQAPPTGSLVTATPLQQLSSVNDSMSGVFADRIIFEAGYLRNI